MQWEDEGYLLSKINYNENSVIINVFTLNHGKCSGIVYGGVSRKIKNFLQVGNKITLLFKSKGRDKIGYFSIELIEAISPRFFEDKVKTACIISATSLLKLLLPDFQVNKKIFISLQSFLKDLEKDKSILFYIFWELFLIKELGFDMDFSTNKIKQIDLPNNIVSFEINGKSFKIPKFIINKEMNSISNIDTRLALNFNKNLLLENFINPNNIKLPFARDILEIYHN